MKRFHAVADPEQLMTAKEVCNILRVSRRTLRRWCLSNRLSYIPLSRNKIVFRKQLIEYFIEKHEIRG
jgi:excisionase family DNA binding protein